MDKGFHCQRFRSFRLRAFRSFRLRAFRSFRLRSTTGKLRSDDSCYCFGSAQQLHESGIWFVLLKVR